MSNSEGTFFANANRGIANADMIGIVTALEGAALENGQIASRTGGFEEIAKLDTNGASAEKLIEAVFRTRNSEHDSYQNGQAFLNLGGKRGMQIDPLLAGKYLLNPAMFSVEMVPMLVVEQGEVAVIKAYVGLEEKDISGEEFKFGTIVKPGYKGIWNKVLHTGKYPLNPYCYEAVKVPTKIITLNWADNVSSAHKLDDSLSTIDAKSNEGFPIKLDLVVQIHIPESEAPRIISSVGAMRNLVNEVLQSAVGNHFRDKLQSMKAVDILNKREEIQSQAFDHIKSKLAEYNKVELVAVLVQDVIYPPELTSVLQERQIAIQRQDTYKAEMEAERQRAEKEKEKGGADIQAELAASKVRIEIAQNKAYARAKEGEGEASYTKQTGQANAAAEQAMQEAQAAGLLKKVEALSPELIALVEVGKALAESQRGVPLFPRTYVGGGSGDLTKGFLANAMEALQGISNVLSKPNEESEITSATMGSGKKAFEEVPDKNLEPTAVSSRTPVVVVENKTGEVEARSKKGQ